MRALEIETIVKKSGNKILIELPESAEYLVNRKFKLSLVDKEENVLNIKDIFNLITSETDELPEDYSFNFEHYLYGIAKRENEK